MLRDKEISKSKGDLGRPYIELLARQRGQGIVEMDAPDVHAYACGFRGKRGTRTWLELMRMLEKAGAIKSKSGNGRQYDTVLIVHPALLVHQLADRLPEDLVNTYDKRQVDAGERTYEQIIAEQREDLEMPSEKVVTMKPGRRGAKKP